MTASDYLLVGHITADIVPDDGRVLGGTVAYAASVAHAFGYHPRIFTSCHPQEPLLHQLKPYATVVNHPAEHTTTFENIYRGDDRQQIVHHLAAPLTFDDLPFDWRDSNLVHLAPLVGELNPHMAQSFPNATTLLTPQGLLRQWDNEGTVSFKPWCDPHALQQIDIVVLSKQDIEQAPELEDEYARWCKTLVVTDGAHGGAYYLSGARYKYLAYPAIERYRTGAGDAFATALLASLPYVDHDIHRAIPVATRVAALTVARTDPAAPLSPEQIRAIVPTTKP